MPESSSDPALPAVTDDRVHILLVDDQPNNLVALEAILSGLDQHLVMASGGKEALRQVLQRDFAVILLDVQMPTMDGYETASMIRQRAASRHTPIIFLTATSSREVQSTRGYDVGAVDYLFKPLDAGILRAKVAVFVDLAKKTALVVRREAEARQLAEMRTQLLAELEQKHRDLAEAHQEIEAFSYSVSHDLRAPLRSIDRFSEALLDDHAAQLDDTGLKYLRSVRDAAQRMNALIDGLLALAQVTRSEVRTQPVDLSRLAREVAARLQQDNRAEIVVAHGLAAVGDVRLLGAALENLLGNALKFSRNAAQPKIEVGTQLHEGKPAFFVRDNGAGFDMAHAEQLFAAFQRLHPNDEFEGHGIGLATVQRIIRRHGGTIWAEGQPGAGATFYFTLAS